MIEPLSSLLLPQAANNRHGVVFSPQVAKLTKSDVQNVFHIGVPYSLANMWKSASGGVGRKRKDAMLAAIGEGIERYCAAIIQVPLKSKTHIPQQQRIGPEEWTLFSKTQRHKTNFPFANLYDDTCVYTSVYDFTSKHKVWVPHPLVVLRDDYQTGIPTSSGLAAGPTAALAALRAIQELVERDALMATWLHSLPGRAIKIPIKYMTQVKNLYGDISIFDLTPQYSPFPVIAIGGGIPARGMWRYSLGVACRETLAQATEKAFLEWCQGVFFAGVYPKFVNTTKLSAPSEVKTFDDHAIYYTQNPKEWHKLPLFKNKDTLYVPSSTSKTSSTETALGLVVKQLHRFGVRLFYRDLTTIDAVQSGIRVVRVLSPDLIPINAHHNWPFIGGNAGNIALRYPWETSPSHFPNPYPHPLG